MCINFSFLHNGNRKRIFDPLLESHVWEELDDRLKLGDVLVLEQCSKVSKTVIKSFTNTLNIL